MPEQPVTPAPPLRPLVTVVVVNHRTPEETIGCLRALRDELDYPADRLELICVDTGSGDGSAERIAAAVPSARVVRATNVGFAGGCNLGVTHGTGTVLAFLNSDARPERQWLSAAVAELRRDPTVAVVASKVLSWDGTEIDFADAAMTWFGMGYKPGVGLPPDERADAPRDVLFATGSAMIARRSVFEALGGFDERFFMFFEDLDLGWRANLRGWRVRYLPTSAARHRHHLSMRTVHPARELYHLERNALAALYKNAGDATLARAMPAALALAVRRATARGELDPGQLDIARRPADPAADAAPIPVAPETVAGLLAIDRFVEMLPELSVAREREQAARVRSDADLRPLLRNALEPACALPSYLDAHRILVDAFGIERSFGGRRRIAVVTNDAVGERMAGPAIRAWHIADLLSAEHDVRLVCTNDLCVAPEGTRFTVVGCRPHELDAALADAEVVILQGHGLDQAPRLRAEDSRQIVVCDLYDPMHLEVLEQGRDLDERTRAGAVHGVTRVLLDQLRRGDAFLCASQRQRHFWLGHLAAMGRLTPTLYDADPTGRALVSVVPFGLPGAPPVRGDEPAIRDLPAVAGHPARPAGHGIGPDEKVILWAGGVYSWFDPLTLLRAVALMTDEHPETRLFFLGMHHPNPDVPEMGMARRARALARELGLAGKQVIFNERWVPYARRAGYLLDADCGVTTHFEHLETTFAFRTRVLDYLWAGLPVVTTDGDAFAELVRAERLGVVVPAQQPGPLADALRRVLFDEEFAAGCRERIAVVREQFTWDAVLAPLAAFCRDPRPAPDRLRPAATPLAGPPALGLAGSVRRDAALMREYLSAGGPAELTRRVAGRMRRVARQRGTRRGG